MRGRLGPTGVRRRELHPLGDLSEGVRWARSDRRVLALLAQKVGFGLGMGMIGLLPVFATRVFGARDAGIGLLYAARGLGTLLGPFAARPFVGTRLRRLFPVIAASMALFGVAYAVFPAAPGLWSAAVIVLVAHVGGGTQYTMTGYSLQLLTPDHVRGRIMAFELTAVTLTMSLSLLLAGRAAETFDPRAVVEALAALTVAYAAVWALATRRLWRGRGVTPSGSSPQTSGGELVALSDGIWPCPPTPSR